MCLRKLFVEHFFSRNEFVAQFYNNLNKSNNFTYFLVDFEKITSQRVRIYV